MVNEIIWVDDEPLWGENHIKELRLADFKVQPFDNVDDADIAYELLVEVNGIVLDINMPWGDLFSEELSAKGLKTGLLLLNLWRDRIISRRQPVCILTNRDVDVIETDANRLKFPAGLIKVLHKRAATSPRSFPDQLGQLLKANGVFRNR